eukprot:jgi/Bigna1/71005/fgenesh1_pg.14_\
MGKECIEATATIEIKDTPGPKSAKATEEITILCMINTLPTRHGQNTKNLNKNRLLLHITIQIWILNSYIRCILQAIGASVLGMLLFPVISIAIRSFLDMGEVYVLSNDQSQFVQNFITVNGLLFSILTGNAFYFLYQQQEALFYALFAEVSEAKSLLEQVTFVCQGRAFYRTVLEKIAKYVKDDLRRIDYPPAVLLSSKPQDDPLESILYLTSVGVVPSIVYETVRSLRQVLGPRQLIKDPMRALSDSNAVPNILSLEGFLFGLLCGGIMLTLQIALKCTRAPQVIHELWSPMGGVYQVDNVLGQMVMGLEEELDQRFQGVRMSETQLPSPPPSFGDRTMPDDDGSSGSDGTRRRPTASESRMTARFNSPEASISARSVSSIRSLPSNYAKQNMRGVFQRSQRDGQTVNPSARDTALSSVTEPELKFYRQLPPPPMSPRENPATTRTKTQQQPSKISRARKFLSKLFGPSS